MPSSSLIKRQLETHGLDEKRVVFGPSSVRSLIDDYTREAGVRNLEREIGSVCRKLVRRVVTDGKPEGLPARSRC